MKKSELKSIAILFGYDNKGSVVYHDEISLDEYYDSEHVWNNPKGILSLRISRIHGQLYNDEGILFLEFESDYSDSSGEYLGGMAVYEDGTIRKHGILSDVLSGGKAPTKMFGRPLSVHDSEGCIQFLRDVGEVAKSEIKKIFDLEITYDIEGIKLIDKVIDEMWELEWSPTKGDIDLFSTHFGSILALSMLTYKNTKPIFRSRVKLDHFSIWIDSENLEYFPFHKAYKCLSSREGDSLTQMIKDLHKSG